MSTFRSHIQCRYYLNKIYTLKVNFPYTSMVTNCYISCGVVVQFVHKANEEYMNIYHLSVVYITVSRDSFSGSKWKRMKTKMRQCLFYTECRSYIAKSTKSQIYNNNKWTKPIHFLSNFLVSISERTKQSREWTDVWWLSLVIVWVPSRRLLKRNLKKKL